ncbi:MAG: hypothetical protein QXE05_08105 [Nitrososphaeria archaeon]
MSEQTVLRLKPELKELLKKVSEARKESMSSFIKRAILLELARLSYLSEDEKKALGVV